MILIRFGELTLKGKNRLQFENTVLNQIRRQLEPFKKIAIQKTYGRVYITLNDEPYAEIKQRLQRVFGLASFSPVIRADLDLTSIQKKCLEAIQTVHNKPKTFKVSAKRAYKPFPYSSMELNQRIGGYVLKHTEGLTVDVHQPDVELKVDVREEGAYVYSEVIPGLGGLPLGSSGKAMLMLSGGIDSPVAGWLSMKRGLKIEAVHFHSFPYTSERAKQKVIDLAAKLAVYSIDMKVHMVPFTEIQTRLNQQGNNHLLITFMRRAMMRITAKLAEKREAAAIITGESLGQVASQTLTSMNVIGRVVDIPILRPLITMDKQEIIQIANKIDTYDISILPYEDCCTLFVPKAPSTKPNLRIVERLEQNMDWMDAEIEKAIQDTELLTINAETKNNTEEHWF